MRYRRLDSNGDMIFGGGQADFLVNSPDAVAQAVGTRLRLDLGDWFLDINDGMNWRTGVLGNRTASTRDTLVRARILDTPGVNSILQYSSTFNPNTRRFSVQVRIDTIFGAIPPTTTSVIGKPSPTLNFTLDSPQLGRLDGIALLG